MIDSYDTSHADSHLLSALLPAATRTLLQDLWLILALILILRGCAGGGRLGGGRGRGRGRGRDRGRGRGSTLYLLSVTGHVCHLWSVSLLRWSASPLWTVRHHDTQPVPLASLGSASWAAILTSGLFSPVFCSSWSHFHCAYVKAGCQQGWAEGRINVNKTHM